MIFASTYTNTPLLKVTKKDNFHNLPFELTNCSHLVLLIERLSLFFPKVLVPIYVLYAVDTAHALSAGCAKTINLGGTRNGKKLEEGKDCEKDNNLFVTCHVFGRFIDGVCSSGSTRNRVFVL